MGLPNPWTTLRQKLNSFGYLIVWRSPDRETKEYDGRRFFVPLDTPLCVHCALHQEDAAIGIALWHRRSALLREFTSRSDMVCIVDDLFYADCCSQERRLRSASSGM